MKINSVINVQKALTPSLKTLTRAFKKQTFESYDTYKAMAQQVKNPFVGTLPSEFIKDIQKLAKDKVEKVKVIKDIMKAFSETSKNLNGTAEESFWAKLMSLFSEAGQQEKTKIRKATKTLNAAFKKAGLIAENESIVIGKIGKGVHSNVFRIKFPKKTNYTDKVIKVYKGVAGDFIDSSRHGVMPEANAAMYISKVQGKNLKKSVFVKPYLASTDSNFILCEYAKNYPRTKRPESIIIEAMEKNNIQCHFVPSTDLVKGHIVDFGTMKNKAIVNKNVVRVCKKLRTAYDYAVKHNKTESFYEDVKAMYKKAKANKLPHSQEVIEGIKGILYDLPNISYKTIREVLGK